MRSTSKATARRPHQRGATLTRETTKRQAKRDGGIALITVVLVIFLLTASGLASVDFTEQESRASGQSRATMRSLYAADAGIQLAISRIQPPEDLTAFSFALADGTVVESRKRSDGAPLVIGRGNGPGAAPPPDGFEINQGSGFSLKVHEINVTAVGNNELTSELEAKIGVLNAGGYN